MKAETEIEPEEDQQQDTGENQEEEADTGSRGVTGYYCWNCNILVLAGEKHTCWR